MSVANTEVKNSTEAIEESDGSRAGSIWIDFFSAATLGIWLGAMIFFSFFFAPAAFKVIGSRHLTGTLVTKLLTYLNIGTLVLVPLWAIACAQQCNIRRIWSTGAIAQFVLLVTMAIASAISEFYLTPMMASLREQMGSVDTTPLDSPLRVAFNDLHHYSVLLLTINMIAALVALFLVIRERRA